ncbi:hypothetical protein D9M72_551980 [compost metagenome]
MIEARALVDPPLAPLSIGRPSITINGSFEAPKEAPPRILISDPEPGAPFVVIVKPATLPFNKFSAVAFIPRLKFFEETTSTAPVASFFLTDPYPTTTTSSNCEASSCKITVIVFCEE